MVARTHYSVRSKQLPDVVVQYCNTITELTAQQHEGGTLTLNITSDEFTILSSALYMGASLVYEEQYLQIWQWLYDALECGYNDNCEQDDFCMTISQEIIDAICACVQVGIDNQSVIINNQNEIITQQELNNFYDTQNDTYQPVPDTLQSEQVSTTTGSQAGATCTNDNAYAVAVAVVDFLEAEIIQMYEAFEGADNVAEFITEIVDGFFLLPEVNDAVSDIAEAILNISEYGKQAFENSFTPQLKQQYYCDIFEIIACNNCLYSIQDIVNYFADKANILAGDNVFDTLGGLVGVLDNLVTGDTTLTADVVFALVTRLQQGGNLLGLQLGGQRRLIKAFLAARDETNNDWNIQCGTPECTWTYIYNEGDDTAKLASFDTSTASVAYNGQIVATRPGSSIVRLQWELPSGSAVTYVSVTYVTDTDTSEPQIDLTDFDVEGGNGTPARQTASGVPETWIKAADPSSQFGGVTIGIQMNFGADFGSLTVQNLEIRGKGANPFI